MGKIGRACREKGYKDNLTKSVKSVIQVMSESDQEQRLYV